MSSLRSRISLRMSWSFAMDFHRGSQRHDSKEVNRPDGSNDKYFLVHF